MSGRFEKGKSGNPAGRKPMPPELKEMARAASIPAMKRAIELINSPDANVALKAINIVLERGYGKAPQPHDGDGQGGPIDMSVTVKFIKPQPKE